MEISALEASTLAYFIVAVIYELILRQELQSKSDIVSSHTYLTFGFILKPMIKIMGFRFWGYSKKLNFVGTIFSSIHYILLVQLVLIILTSSS
jgi:hypothetical protein